jgi:RNA polymerase sigma-70 factor (ECF subfamily)
VLYGVALRILRRPEWAQEVLQESYVAAWRHAARYDSERGAVMTWLIRIVRNQAFDRLAPTRADSHAQLHALDASDDDLLERVAAGDDSDPQRRAHDAQDAARLADCLGALDAAQRQSLMLVFFHGLSHGDLAQHMKLPLGTVKAWVRRGLKRLRLCLGAQAA